MANQDRIRILRLVEYVGPREWVEKQVANSIHGTRRFRQALGEISKDGGQVTAVTIGEFGESIAESGILCKRCGNFRDDVHPAIVRRANGKVERYPTCMSCLEHLKNVRDGQYNVGDGAIVEVILE